MRRIECASADRLLAPSDRDADVSSTTQSAHCYAHCRTRADRLACMARCDEAGSGLAAKRRLDQVLQDPRALGDQRPSSSKQVHVTASQQMGLRLCQQDMRRLENTLAVRYGCFLTAPSANSSQTAGFSGRHDTCQSSFTSSQQDQCEQWSLLCAFRRRPLLGWPDALGLASLGRAEG